jgi:hypothetical protein
MTATVHLLILAFHFVTIPEPVSQQTMRIAMMEVPLLILRQQKVVMELMTTATELQMTD